MGTHVQGLENSNRLRGGKFPTDWKFVVVVVVVILLISLLFFMYVC